MPGSALYHIQSMNLVAKNGAQAKTWPTFRPIDTLCRGASLLCSSQVPWAAETVFILPLPLSTEHPITKPHASRLTLRDSVPSEMDRIALWSIRQTAERSVWVRWRRSTESTGGKDGVVAFVIVVVEWVGGGSGGGLIVPRHDMFGPNIIRQDGGRW